MYWNPKVRAQEILARMTRVTADNVKGAHDAQMVIAGGKAYIVYEANDVRPGESGEWPYVYSAMSIVDIRENKLLSVLEVARSGQVYTNETLKPGACFVPRILIKDPTTLRVFFASMEPGVRQDETWYIDFDLKTETFSSCIYRLKLETKLGVFLMEPRHFYAQARLDGFTKKERDNAMYLFDIGKQFDGHTYVALNNFGGKQNALGVFNEALDTVRVIGNFNEPQSEGLSESAVNRMPDGSWIAIVRNDSNNKNYRFTRSSDGVSWTPAEEWPIVQNGSNSKPLLDRFGGVYYLGWQEKPDRTRFNIDVSIDFVHWTRAYSFDNAEFSLQYPSLCEADGNIYICGTHGAVGSGGECRDSIWFTRLNTLEEGRELCSEIVKRE